VFLRAVMACMHVCSQYIVLCTEHVLSEVSIRFFGCGCGFTGGREITEARVCEFEKPQATKHTPALAL